MTPNFALSLSFDGLRLLMRGDAGWLLVGEVALDARDLRAALADLRHRGERLAGGPFEVKLLIPNEQIRYLALDGTRVTEDQVRAALDGATPYSVPDLVYDYTKGGGRTYIAAVARETLEEAEAFAREHGMTPVSFAAMPEPFTFVGEVVFGPVSTDPDRDVIRDPDPVRVVGRAHLPGGAAPRAGSAAEADAARDTAAGPAPDAEAALAPGAAEVSDGAAEATRETGADNAAEGDGSGDGTGVAGEALAPRAAEAADGPVDEPGTEADPAPAEAVPDPSPDRTPETLANDAEPPAEPPPVFASQDDAALSPGRAGDEAGAPVAAVAATADAPEEDEAAEDDVAVPMLVFSTRRARTDEGAPRPEAPATDLMARASMPPAPRTSEPEPEPEPAPELKPEPGPAADAPAPPPPARSEPAPAAAPPARPAIFSRAARTPQPPRFVPAPAAPAEAPPFLQKAAQSAPLTEPGEVDADPPQVSDPLPPLPSRRIPMVPAPAGTTASATPLRVERASPALRQPAFLDGLSSPDDPPRQRPSWRETLAQRMRGKGATGGAPSAEPVAPPAEPAAVPAKAAPAPAKATKPPAKRPALAFAASRDTARDTDTAPAAPRVVAAPKPVDALTPGAAATLTAERPIPSGAAVPMPRPGHSLKTDATPAAPETPPVRKSAGPRILRRREAAPADATASGERARMTVFGARRAEESRAVGGKPRYLGLMLTAILLLAMAVVAAMAGAPEALSRLFAPRPEATEVAAAPAPAPASARNLSLGAPPIGVPAAPGLPIASSDSVAAAQPDATEADPEALAAAPEVTDRAPEALPLQSEPADSAPVETVATAPEPAAPRAAPAPIGRVLSPSEAQRIYAATGVWQRAPRIPLTPGPDQEPGLTATTEVELPVRPPVPGRPMDVAQVLTDVRIPTPADPPPPGSGFERDARGFILATAEGTLTPDGILVFAGAPPLMPDLRPGTIAPLPDPTALAPEGAVAEATAGTLVIEAAPELVPPLRSEEIAAAAGLDPAETTPGASADGDGPEAAAPGVALVQTPAIIPPVRPASVTARAIEATGAETAALVAEEDPPAAGEATGADVVATPGVSFLATPAIIPRSRPAGLAPLPTPETAPESPEGSPAAAIRPDDPAATAAETPPEAGAPPPGVAFIETRAIRPPSRPDGLAPAETAPAETITPPAPDPSDAAAPARTAPRGDVVYVSTRAIDPPARPGTRAPAAAPETATPASYAVLQEPPPVAPLTRPGTAPSTPAAAAAALPVVRVAAPAVTPPVRSAGVLARAADRLEAERAAIAARAATVRVVDTTPGGVSLASLDPPLRPESILAAARAAAPGPATEAATEVSLRPRARPGELAPETELAEADDAREESEAEAAAAEAASQRNADLLAAAAAAANALGASVPGLASATPQAVASSIRPDARPRNMATLVDRARQQQQRDQARSAAAPAAAAPQSTAATRVQPSGRTANTVAAAATIDNAINLNRINLIGVYGRLDDRRALVRLSGGRYVRVAVGDRLDGGQVSAIGDGYLTYARGGRNVRLDVPG